jgi:hypothetical protein
MNQELQLGKYEFFPYDEKIQRLLDELLPNDEEREKQGKNYPDKLLERKKRQSIRHRKSK